MNNANLGLIFFGIAGLLAGSMLLGVGVYCFLRMRRLGGTPLTASAVSLLAEEGRSADIVASGICECKTPLVSPVTKTECVYYHHLIESHKVRVADAFGVMPVPEWNIAMDEDGKSPFALRDSSGVVFVSPEHAEFEGEEKVRRTPGAIAYHEPAVDGPKGALEAYVRAFPNGIKTGQHRTSEWVIPVGAQVHVRGEAVKHKEWVEIRKGQGPFFISSLSRPELKKRYDLVTILCLSAGGMVFIDGLICLLVGK
jgi:hypothetical protein